MSVTVRVNGETRRFDAPLPLLALRELEALAPATPNAMAGGEGIAVALNGEVVPRRSWHERRLQDGDIVEIVHATQGG